MSALTLSLDLKSARLSALLLPLRSRDLDALLGLAEQRWGGLSGAFEGEPLVLDAADLPAGAALDWPRLLKALRAYGLQPVALQGHALLDEAEREKLRALGLQLTELDAAPAARAATAAESAPAPAPAPAPATPTPASRCLVVERPLRSGQQIYARDCDLIVLGLVSHGAEVIADGHIHVYGALRGRAIAGAKGQLDARIFAQSLEAELLAVAGTFRTSEKPLPADVFGKPAQVRLDGERLLFEPLKY
jgi:septum site-determining protein MinC